MASKIMICEFENIGATCYMNASLQLLFHCNAFVNFLVPKKNKDGEDYCEYEKYLLNNYKNIVLDKYKNIDIPDNITMLHNQVEKLCNDPHIAKTLSQLIILCKVKGRCSINPEGLKELIDKKFVTTDYDNNDRIVKQFPTGIQHDARDFLFAIVDLFVEELFIPLPETTINVADYMKDMEKQYLHFKNLLKNASGNDKEKIHSEYLEFKKKNSMMIGQYEGYIQIQQYFSKKYNPFIYNIKLFTMYIYKCNACNNFKYIYDNNAFLMLTLESHSNKTSNLEEHLDDFLKENIVENVKCEFCNKNQTMTKTEKILRLPMTLFIVLKRFYRKNNRNYKNNLNITIPENLDLKKYSCPSNNGTKYKLKGFINHYGSMNSGHYNADCKCIVNNNTWYNLDDTTVKKYDNNKVPCNKNAYVLMYEME